LCNTGEHSRLRGCASERGTNARQRSTLSAQQHDPKPCPLRRAESSSPKLSVCFLYSWDGGKLKGGYSCSEEALKVRVSPAGHRQEGTSLPSQRVPVQFKSSVHLKKPYCCTPAFPLTSGSILLDKSCKNCRDKERNRTLSFFNNVP